MGAERQGLLTQPLPPSELWKARLWPAELWGELLCITHAPSLKASVAHRSHTDRHVHVVYTQPTEKA